MSVEGGDRMPAWLREIGASAWTAHPDWTAETAYITISASGNVTRHASFPDDGSPNAEYPCARRIALFRDGPIAKPSTGGATTLLGMVDALLNVGCEVFLFYCLRGAPDGEKPISLSELSRTHNKAFTFSEVVCFRPEDFYSERGSALVGKILRTLGISICHFESAEAVQWQCPTVQLHTSAKIVFEVFDVESILERCTDVAATRALELHALQLADSVLVRSEVDKNAMLEIGGHQQQIAEKIFMYRGCAGKITTDCKDADLSICKKKVDLLYVGNMWYPPNATAIRILMAVLPEAVTLLVVGNCPPSLIKEFQYHNNITLSGFVDDLGAVCRSAWFGIAPLMSHGGSGTSLKVLDYGIYGLPIIATDFAFRGIEPELKHLATILPEEAPDVWPKLITKSLADRESLSKIAASTRNLFVRFRSWQNTISDILRAYHLKPLSLSLNAAGGGLKIALEGMPRSGKTTTFERLRQMPMLRHASFFEEVQPTQEFLEAHMAANPCGDLTASMWFLNRECALKKGLNSSSTAPSTVVSDRSFLCTFAYRYADDQVKKTI